MQATSVAVRPALSVRPLSPLPRRKKLPKTFEEALKLGWFVFSERTSIARGKRRGEVVMAMKVGPARLLVPYTGTQAGYQFGVPRLA